MTYVTSLGEGALVLDRFRLGVDRRLHDLATGAAVGIRSFEPASVAGQQARATRCARMLGVDRPDGRRLIDFGPATPGRWVEVFLRSGSNVKPRARALDRPSRSGEVPGLEDVLASCGPADLRLLAWRGPAHVLNERLLDAARTARLHGFVPCHLSLLASDVHLRSQLAGRHLVVLVSPMTGPFGQRGSGAGAVVIDLSLVATRPRVILLMQPSAHVSVEPAIEPVDPEALFADGSRLDSRPLCVAEAAGRYDGGDACQRTEGSRVALPGCERARHLSAVGRHTEAHRLLRRTIGGLSRRGRTDGAAACGLVLAELLRARGRTADALAVLQDTRRLALAGRDGECNVRVAVATGRCHVDDGRLHEGESVLRSAELGAVEVRRNDLRAEALTSLGRCLLWQGRFVDADHMLRRAEESVGPSVGLKCHSARLSLARGDFGRAHAEVREALRLARLSEDAPSLLKAAVVMAELKASVGDIDAMDTALREVLAGRPSREIGLWDLRIRAVRVEGLVRGGCLAEARVRGAQLLRHARRTLPGLLRGRLLRAGALALAGRADGERARRELESFVRISAAAQLRLPGERGPSEVAAASLVDVLRACQEHDDELQGLEQVCEVVRQRVHALSVGLYTSDPGSGVLAGAGPAPRARPEGIERLLDSGLDLPVCRVRENVQAAAVVRVGGAAVAVLVVRWAADASPTRVWIDGFLPACATACGPGVRAVLDRLAPSVPAAVSDLDLLGPSRPIAEVREAVLRAASAAFPVLILGESGSGKELVARAVHRAGLRSRRRFCTVNCAAVTDDLFEAELFGHVRGAFTGAVAERPGLFEEADGGTLFLDEVGDLSGRAQAKLLRAIQYGEVRRVGENVPRRVDARIVAATNRPLDEAAASGRFRTDLLYRLDVIRIVVPPLRDRPQDIPHLARHFWARATAQIGSRARLDESTIAALSRYEWPGNVRELENVIAALAVRSPVRGHVRPAALPPVLLRSAASSGGALENARRRFERHFIAAALARAGGRRSRAAMDLGVTRQGLAKLIRRLGLDAPGSSSNGPYPADRMDASE